MSLTAADNYTNTNVTLKAANSISATNAISGTSKVNYQAANSVELLPGFSVGTGSVFVAKIQGCDN
jgi:hypothetical protein